MIEMLVTLSNASWPPLTKGKKMTNDNDVSHLKRDQLTIIDKRSQNGK